MEANLFRIEQMVKADLDSLIVQLNISAEEMHRFYSGEARYVHAHSVDGRSIRFSANLLRQICRSQWCKRGVSH